MIRSANFGSIKYFNMKMELGAKQMKENLKLVKILVIFLIFKNDNDKNRFLFNIKYLISSHYYYYYYSRAN